jgi:hypothetical protein
MSRTTEPTLTDRYVFATLRSLPADRRADLGRELRSTIGDMVDAHLADGATPEEAERSALLTLGNPTTLGASYLSGPQHLIGPRFYGVWRCLLRNLLTWVPALIAALSILGDVLDDTDHSVGDLVGTAVVTALMTAVQVSFWLTLVFAIVERTAQDEEILEWSPDSLPQLPEDNGVGLGEAAFGATFNLLLAVLLVAQHFRTGVGEGGRTPLLDPALWSFWLPFLVLVCLASAGLELWRYRNGWTVPGFVATVVLTLASAGPIAWLADSERLLNPEFVEAVGMSSEAFDILTKVVVAGAVLVALWEIGEAAWRTFVRNRAPELGR